MDCCKKSDIKKEKYRLPEFNIDRLMLHIDSVIEQSPSGIVQLVIDLFCGAGGTSEGIENARYMDKKNSVIIVGINHDIIAIYSQAKNHPLAYYTTEDIRFANLSPIKKIIDAIKIKYPNCPIILWGSLECTNHSNAKGGMSRNADSRTLPWELYRYIKLLNPDGIWIENVREFAEWGPLMEKVVIKKDGKSNFLRKPVPADKEAEFYQVKIQEGYNLSCPLERIKEKKKVIGFAPVWVPIKDEKGTYFYPWKQEIDNYGYHNQHRILNAADFGAATNRKRLILIFMRKGWPITWPHPTHSKMGGKDAFDNLQKHVPVRDCLDFSDEGESIFIPGRITSEESFKRIYAGLIKFVAGGEDKFVLQRNSGQPLSKVYPINAPAKTLTTTDGNQMIVSTCFLVNYNRNSDSNSIDEPSPTLCTKDKLAKANVEFIDVIYGNGYASSIDNPAPTLRTKDCLAFVNAKYFIYSNYSGGGTSSAIEQPHPTILANPKQRLIKVEPWIMDTQYGNIGTDINEPLGTITANRKYHYILNPQWGGNHGDINKPMFTLIARMDKAPPYLITTNSGHVAIPVFKSDTETIIKIKEFMAIYSIKDVKMRMLHIVEMLKIQSFPENYFLAGSKADKKKFIGNSVPPKLSQAIGESMFAGLLPFLIKKLAA